MENSRFEDAAAFLRHAGPFLRADAIGNNVMLGIAERLVDAPWDGAVMLTVDGGNGAPCLAGLMTPPWRLIVSTGDAEAAPALVEAAGAQPATWNSTSRGLKAGRARIAAIESSTYGLRVVLG